MRSRVEPGLPALLLAAALATSAAAQVDGVPPAGGDGALPPHPGMAGVEAPPLAELLARARERSPRLAVLSARRAAAEARVEPAGALANPMLEAELQNVGLDRFTVGDDEMSMLELGVRQALPYPGKREARRAAARAEAGMVAAERAAAERELERDVTALVARLYALDRERLALEEAHELLEMLAATVAARYGAGGAEQEAVLKVQLELSMHDERRIEVAGERAGAEAGLRRLLDLPAGTPIGEVRRLPEVAPLPAGLAVAAASRAPEVAVRRAAEVVGQHRVEVERLELRPDFSVGGGLGLRGSNDPVLLLGFGVELPFWRKSRQEPLIAAAEHDAAAAGEERREAEIAARGEAERLLGAWWRLAGQLRLAEEAILPQSSAAFDAARSSYLHGRGDFSTVIEDYARWLDARVRHARLEAERLEVRAALAALLDEENAGAAALDPQPLPIATDLPKPSAEGAQP